MRKLTYGFTPDSVAALEMPVLLVNLGDDGRWPAIDVGPKGSDLAGCLPDAGYAVIAPASHFTFLATCKPGAPALLEAEGDDPICDDPPGTDRGRAHSEIIAHVAKFLDL